MIDFARLAEELEIEEATLRAVVEVESNGKPFLSDGRPQILFEAHIFYRELKKKGFDAYKISKQMPSICSQKWNRSYYLGGAKEYERLARAEQVDKESALMSASWGMFQIMGFNYATCDCENVIEFVNKCHTTEGMIRTFIAFCRNNNLVKYLQAKDWAGFARRYNGKSYAVNKYDEKLANAYAKYS